MSKDSFSLMDFVKRQSIGSIQQVFGEECLNEDGTLMSLADQASVITHYVQLSNHSLCNDILSRTAQQLIPKWEAFLRSRNFRIVG